MFSICDKGVYLNTATRKFDTAVIKGIQIVPTGISKDEEGEDVLDGSVVLYQTKEGPMLTEAEVFASEEEAKKVWTEVIASL